MVSDTIVNHCSRRLLRSPTVPLWSDLIGIANELEEQLGIDEPDRLRSERPIVEISADPIKLQRLLAIMPHPRRDNRPPA
ncbi:hypothetical protein OH799_32600 [Nocardia sp. NBC_00881]|uniref:hypothetical protein n=1 Tax=Nocardia sp. NBC_00881 TaxID=2975995 RepID=UPI003862EBA6|nr:hypothetical protein OH799_32600 [Nocardia sp. NBC_00881]